MWNKGLEDQQWGKTYEKYINWRTTVVGKYISWTVTKKMVGVCNIWEQHLREPSVARRETAAWRSSASPATHSKTARCSLRSQLNMSLYHPMSMTLWYICLKNELKISHGNSSHRPHRTESWHLLRPVPAAAGYVFEKPHTLQQWASNRGPVGLEKKKAEEHF